MSVPTRIERKRRRGWRTPAGAVYVGRPTIWSNPFRITRSSDFHGLPGSWFLLDAYGVKYHPDQDTERSARQKAADLFAAWVTHHEDGAPTVDRIRAELAGRDLICWCPRREPCHADVLLEIANSTGPVTPPRGRAAGPLPVRPEPVGQHLLERAGAGDDTVRTGRVNPVTARRPHIDPAGAEQLHAFKQNVFDDSLVRQPTPNASSADVLTLTRENPNYSELSHDLETLPQRLLDGEPILLLALGSVSACPALIALTDRRLIVHRDNPTCRHRDEMPMPAQVSWSSGLNAGELSFQSASHELKITNISDATAEAFLDALK